VIQKGIRQVGTKPLGKIRRANASPFAIVMAFSGTMRNRFGGNSGKPFATSKRFQIPRLKPL